MRPVDFAQNVVRREPCVHPGERYNQRTVPLPVDEDRRRNIGVAAIGRGVGMNEPRRLGELRDWSASTVRWGNCACVLLASSRSSSDATSTRVVRFSKSS